MLAAGSLAARAGSVTAACSSANSVNVQHNKAGGGSGGYKYKIDVVTHGGAGDSFWDVVKNGAVQAGKDEGDTSLPERRRPDQQSQLIDNAVAARSRTASSSRWPTPRR